MPRLTIDLDSAPDIQRGLAILNGLSGGPEAAPAAPAAEEAPAPPDPAPSQESAPEAAEELPPAVGRQELQAAVADAAARIGSSRSAEIVAILGKRKLKTIPDAEVPELIEKLEALA